MSYTLQNISILLVEDSRAMSTLVKSLLLAFGIKNIYMAKSGNEGYDLYLRHEPDLVLTDWMMKDGDGLQLARAIRFNEKGKNQFVPIVMMTGFSEKVRVIEARDAGVTEFLVKPFSARDLYLRLEEIIERPRQFVKSETFFGPSRRRRPNPNYQGEIKRETDPDIERNMDALLYDEEKPK